MPLNINIKRNIYMLTVLSVGVSLSIVISIFESMIPAFPMLPVGTKLGFANVVTMYIAASFGILPALIVAVLKSVFVGFTRGIVAFLMSFSGSVFSTLVTGFLLRSKRIKMGFVSIGIIGALIHNLSQIIVASLLTTTAIFIYLPWIIIVSVLTGTLTGFSLSVMIPKLEKLNFKDKNLN